MKNLNTVFILVIFLLFNTQLVFCSSNGMKKSGRMAPEKSGEMEAPCDLTPVFENGANCEKISSAFGSQTRYDGSLRPVYRYGGKHGGIDLSLEIGTPLLAVAAGEVIHKGSGSQMEGYYILLLHTPDETGLYFPLFTKYQHLKELPKLEPGQKVTVGQIVGLSGKSGTVGGHFGSEGYPHLHMSCIKTKTGKFKIINGKFVYKNGILIDPLLVYNQGNKKNKDRKVLIPYQDAEGIIHPKNSKTIWPVACE